MNPDQIPFKYDDEGTIYRRPRKQRRSIMSVIRELTPEVEPRNQVSTNPRGFSHV
jgi:hypothetical protein